MNNAGLIKKNMNIHVNPVKHGFVNSQELGSSSRTQRTVTTFEPPLKIFLLDLFSIIFHFESQIFRKEKGRTHNNNLPKTPATPDCSA